VTGAGPGEGYLSVTDVSADVPVIAVRNLTRVFGDLTAVDRVNLEIRQGEIYGFLGPNGAGKTTTLLMLLGTIRPTRGEIAIFGEPMAASAAAIKRRLGVVPERLSFYDEMTAWEYLMFFAELYGVGDSNGRAESLLRRMELWDWRDMPVGHYSHGMQRKLSIVRALVHSPDLVVLDEPVSGLDPYGIRQVREILLEEQRAGRTILVSSHVLSEVERLANRVGIMADGRLLVEDTLDRLVHPAGGSRRIEIELVDGPTHTAEAIRALAFVTNVEVRGKTMIVSTSPARDYRPELGWVLADLRAVLGGMRELEGSLEDAFLTITDADARAWAREGADGRGD
jgi:ABC-type multidrug transport system ATPase subunit